MQTPGPYQGPTLGVDHFTERAYDNHLNSHSISSNSYLSYHHHPHQPSPASTYSQFNNATPSAHAVSGGSNYHSNQAPFGCQPQYASACGDNYGNGSGRGQGYSGSITARPSGTHTEAKSYWSEHQMSVSNSHGYGESAQGLRASGSMSNPSHMPPPSLRSPPQSAGNGYGSSGRQPQSPQNWSHSPRGTPSPLPHAAQSRSPGHCVSPFSPPPLLASHAQNKVLPGNGNSSSSSTTSQPPGANPLQSLQKMVMIDPDSSDSSVSRGSYDPGHAPTPPASAPLPPPHPPHTSLPRPPSGQKSFFSSVEQMASNDPESPYPTYYNLDQNRLCTPPRSSPGTVPGSSYSSLSNSPPKLVISEEHGSDEMTPSTKKEKSNLMARNERLERKPNLALVEDPLRERLTKFGTCPALDPNEASNGSNPPTNTSSNYLDETQSGQSNNDLVSGLKCEGSSVASDSECVKMGSNSVDSYSFSSDSEMPLQVKGRSTPSNLQWNPDYGTPRPSVPVVPGDEDKLRTWAESTALGSDPKLYMQPAVSSETSGPQLYHNREYPDTRLMPPPLAAAAQYSTPLSQGNHAWGGPPPMICPSLRPNPAAEDGTPVQKKKRGRPFGSKNKPKAQVSPGNEAPIPLAIKHTPDVKPVATPRKQRREKTRTEEVGVNTTVSFDANESNELGILPVGVRTTPAFGVSQPFNKKKSSGPYIRVEKDKKKESVSFSVVNVAKKLEDERDSKKQKGPHGESRVDPIASRRPSLISGASKKKLVLNLSQQNDPLQRDLSWVCVFCKQGCHHRGLGDLFGPYFVKAEVKQPPPPACSLASPSEGSDNKRTSLSLTANSDTESTPGPSKRSKKRIKGLTPDSEKEKEADKRSKTLNKSPGGFEPQSPEVQGKAGAPSSCEGQQEVWFHEDCIAWSNGVYLVGHRVRNIEEIVKDSCETVCTKCKLTGANLGCLNKGCSSRFHYMCAKDKGCELEEDNFSVYCPKHKRKPKDASSRTKDGSGLSFSSL